LGCNENFAAASITSSKPHSSSFKLEKKKSEPDMAGKFWREILWRKKIGSQYFGGKILEENVFHFSVSSCKR
jgi:hypothetical protein